MAYNFEGITILVVEGNPAIRKLVCDILKVFGVGNVVVAEDGEEGLKRFQQYNPDIVITELVLDKLDGPDMITKIRQDPFSPNPYVPIIILTAFSEIKRIKTARDSGVSEIMAKPFTARDLYGRLSYVIENPRQFVITENFKGPDRRRKKRELYSGPNRREDDQKQKDAKRPKKAGFSIYTGKQQTAKPGKDTTLTGRKPFYDKDIDYIY